MENYLTKPFKDTIRDLIKSHEDTIDRNEKWISEHKHSIELFKHKIKVEKMYINLLCIKIDEPVSELSDEEEIVW